MRLLLRACAPLEAAKDGGRIAADKRQTPEHSFLPHAQSRMWESVAASAPRSQVGAAHLVQIAQEGRQIQAHGGFRDHRAAATSARCSGTNGGSHEATLPNNQIESR